MIRLALIITVFILTFGMFVLTPTLQADTPSGMVLIPGGEFEMGDHYGVGDAEELPLHDVFIDSFYMDIYEVTNQQYCDYLNSAYSQGLIEVIEGVVYKFGDIEPYCDTNSADSESPIHWDGDTFTITTGKEDHPVAHVSWYGAAAYTNWRSEQDGKMPCYNLSTWKCFPTRVPVWLKEVMGEAHVYGPSLGYRLPTEAEWEYAARGGKHNEDGGLRPDIHYYYKYPWGNDIDSSKANYNSSGTVPVGSYDPNGYGLYDMTGNVFEWCNDWYNSTYYSTYPYYNPHGPLSGVSRVRRGGSWVTATDNHMRIARRKGNEPDARRHGLGFRLIQASD